MLIVRFDTEANGFVRGSNSVSMCVVRYWMVRYVSSDLQKSMNLLRYFGTFDVLIAHNGIGYEISHTQEAL